MAASWEMLRLAISEKDFSMATSTMCQELECDHADLVPLLSGMLSEVIRKDEVAKAKRVTKGSAFSRFNKTTGQDEESGGRDSAKDQVAEAARRCWRSSVRSLFSHSAEAALAMLSDLADAYSSRDFIRAAKEVNDEWRHSPSNTVKKMVDINHLCLQVGGPVLERYGFSPDEKGDKEFRLILGQLSKTSTEVKEKENQNRRLVFKAFPDLYRDQEQGDDSDPSDED